MATSPQKRKQQRDQLSHLQGEEEDDDNYFDDDIDTMTDPEEMEEEQQPDDGPRSHRQKKRRRKQQTQQPSLSRQGPDNNNNNNPSMPTATKPLGKTGGDDMYMEGGPVTRARANRGEIPTMTGGGNTLVQPASPKQKPIEEEDGIKLKVELNLDVEVELKANIGGDLTLTLLT